MTSLLINMPVICLVDKTEHDCLEHLHLYLRKLKIKQEDYYVKYHKKLDLLTGDPIKFKNPEQYLATDFNDKRNLKKWVQQNPEKGKEWCLTWFKNRIAEKELKFAPSHAELLTLTGPSMHYFESIGGYNKICESLGLTVKFKNQELIFTPLPAKAKVIIDTREQLPLNIAWPTVTDTISCGDYGLDAAHDKKVYIERKSQQDFRQTLTRDLGRFQREIARAKEEGSYLVVLVESPINDIVAFDFMKKAMKHMARVKATSAHVFKNMRDIMKENDNVQFLFVANRKEAAKATVKILELGESVKHIDLQYAAELGRLELVN